MLAGLLIATALITQVEASPPADLAAQVRRLVHKLDAPEAEARDAAEKQLMELGPRVVAFLPEKAEDNPELQERLTRIRQKFSAQEESKQLSMATKITLSGTYTMDEFRAAIEKQTENKIVDYRPRLRQAIPNPKLELDIKNTDFWPALDALLDSAGLSVYTSSGSDGLALVERNPQELPRASRGIYTGPLRIEANRIVAERRPTTSNPGSLILNLEIAWEPRLLPILFTQEVKQIHVVDEQGKLLSINAEQPTIQAAVQNGGTAVEMAIPLVVPDRSVSKIGSLKGKLNAMVAGKVETFEFNKLSEAARLLPLVQKKKSTSVTLDKVAKNNELWEIGIRVRFDDVPVDTGAVNAWILQNEAYMIGADGKRIDNAGFHSAQMDNDFGVVYQFELPASGVDGCTFVYKTPSGLCSLLLDYELKDLPLP